MTVLEDLAMRVLGARSPATIRRSQGLSRSRSGGKLAREGCQ